MTVRPRAARRPRLRPFAAPALLAALLCAQLFSARATAVPILDEAPRLFVTGTAPVRLALAGEAPGDPVLANLVHADPERARKHIEATRDADGLHALSFLVDGIYGFRTATGPVVIRRSAFENVARITYTPRSDERIDSLHVTGSFNGWRERDLPMRYDETAALYEVSLPVKPGRYEYKLIRNGAWIANPDEPARRDDFFGGWNSLLVTGVEEKPPRILPESRETVGDTTVYRFRSADGRPLQGLLQAEDRLHAGALEGDLLAFRVPRSDRGRYLHLTYWDAQTTFGPAFLWFEGAQGERDLMAEVLYFAMVDRFRNGNPANDDPVGVNELHPNADWRGGDLAGIRAAIEEGYFERLGVTALWISPVVPAARGVHRDALPPNRLYTAYHGYWPVELDGVDPRFGTPEELKALTAAARARGMRTLCDLVFNHVHDQSSLPREHPDWFNPIDLPDGRRNIRLHDEFPWSTWFDEFLPDFNFDNPAALDHALARGLAYVRDFGFDGVRLDSVKHLPPHFVRTLRSRAGRDLPFLGETLSDRHTIAGYIGSDLLDGQFDFPLYHTVVATLARENRDMRYLVEEIERSQLEYPAGAIMCNLLGNHDFPRFLAFADGRIPPDSDGKDIGYTDPPRAPGPEAFERLKLAYAFLFTMRGVPLVYYGDERGMTGAGDPDNRRMMIDEKEMAPAAREVFATVRALSDLRRARPSLYAGALVPVALGAEHLAFVKGHFDGDRLLVVLNRGLATELHVDVPSWMPAGSFKDLLGGKTYAARDGVLRLPVEPHRFFVLEPVAEAGKGGPEGGKARKGKAKGRKR